MAHPPRCDDLPRQRGGHPNADEGRRHVEALADQLVGTSDQTASVGGRASLIAFATIPSRSTSSQISPSEKGTP